MSARDLHDPEDERPEPWEKQPWESTEAFQVFTTYYLNMRTRPRKVSMAYRGYLAAKGVPFNSKKPAPGNWMRWSQGKNSKDEVIPGSMTWKDRANAYDQWLQRSITERRIKRADSAIMEWEALAVLMLTKFKEVIQLYDPIKDRVDLLTLMTAMEKFQRVFATVFGVQTPITVEVGAIGDSSKAAAGSMTLADRFQAMAQIFQQAVTRKDQADGEDVTDAIEDLTAVLQRLGDGAEGEDDEADT